MAFVLDDRLERDTLPVGDLALSRLLLMNDATYPWVILVPRVAGAAEIIDLSPSDRARLLDEIVAVSTALRDETEPVKLNVAALGNMVRQLHVHIVARFEADPAWPGPVWGKVPPVPYRPEAADALVSRLRDRLAPSPVPVSS
jgi:diadenosine tetraphosphate (Ap4A) HIT family hydrolase